MGFFKRKEALTIPPVEPSGGVPDRRPSPQPMRGGGRPDPYTSNSFGGGRNNGPPPQQGGYQPYQPREHKDPYAAVQADRQMGSNPNNPYARKGVPSQADRDNDAARNELFGGMKPQSQGPSREGTPGAGAGRPPSYATEEDAARAELFGGMGGSGGGGEIPAPRRREYGYQGRELEEDFDEDEEIEGIKQSMRETKQDSLQSTRNALRMAREAEETARGTMARLGDQSERLANSERHLDMAKANNQRAEDKTQELKILNRSIFRPAIVFNKEGKRQAKEQKILERHNMEKEDRARAMRDVQDSRRRLGEAANERSFQDPSLRADRRLQRQRYQFDATASDDELEDELDENLNEMLDISKRLKNISTAMGSEVDTQNKRIGKITDKTDDLNIKISMNTDRLKLIK